MAINHDLTEILRERGLPLHLVPPSGKGDLDFAEREVKKAPTERTQKLLDLYYDTLSSVDTEFTYWYTRRWDELEGDVLTVRRAEALKSAFSHLTPNIIPGEKLVLQKSKFYRGSFPMPWVSEQFLLDEEGTQARTGAASSGDNVMGIGGGNVVRDFGEVVSVAGKFGLRREELPNLKRLAGSWRDRSVEDVIHRYEALVPDYDLKQKLLGTKITFDDSAYTLVQGRETMNFYFPLQYGLEGVKKLAQERKEEVAGKADGDAILGMDRLYYYQGVQLVIEGLQIWILNHAKLARKLEARETEAVQKKEYEEIAACLEWIAYHKPRTFREAFQLVYALHIASSNEDPICGVTPGRLGQILYPWFEQDIAAGRTTEAEVLELLQLHRVKLTCLDIFASPNIVGGANSGNTYNNVAVGGLKKDGSSAVNRLEYLIVEAGITCNTPQPTLSCLYDEKLPEEFLLKCVECNKTGVGYPAWINNRGAMDILLKQFANEGMTVNEARAIAIGGCLAVAPGGYQEIELNGKFYDIPGGAGLTTLGGVASLALPKILEHVLNNGYDHKAGLQVYPPHNRKLQSYEELFTQFKAYYEQTCAVLIRFGNLQHDIARKNNMSILNSFMKPDCLSKGHHNGQAGYRYNGTMLTVNCGTGTLINSLAAIKKWVYEEKKYTLEELTEALKENFGFYESEEAGSFSLSDQKKRENVGSYDEIYRDCLRAPKHGNADLFVDELLAEYEGWMCQAVQQCESLYGKPLQAAQFVTAHHGPQGIITLASADGRLSGTTYSDASMSAYPGTDKNGPYALFASATVWDHTESQSSQLNLKLHPTAVAGVEGSKKLLELTRSYLRKGGQHIQYNVVDSKVLKDAQRHPERYRDLLVRVAGFTQYWCELSKPIQDEVVARTEYEGVI
ncbi:4-hydroxyphenylacetate decarboxylase large subunit [Anaeroarcus burkinensis]|uniref:4-hydroxyphenylacetate decarboxylase large subunit n=1 Tax=Anaeroarcus burkinensis TaxID=82376 RepID=UPI0003FB3228|nr:4-hydroxyphenylacetate decarboxylase large subunit [Anaeroarcus burkinensis]